MANTRRLFKSFYRLLLPVVVLFVISLTASSVWLVHRISVPPAAPYLVTPARYGQLSSRGAQITEETWQNNDGTTARGWLLRGAMNAPAVILLHSYGADRSYVLNLGVKLNEATDFTVLMPDLRGHGEAPPSTYTSFGGCEASDVQNAIAFLRGLRLDSRTPLVGQHIGLYGIEAGALAAIFAASEDASVTSVVLDSVPANSNTVLSHALSRRYPFASGVTSEVAGLGTFPFFYDGCYRRESSCTAAKALSNRHVLLLAGADFPELRRSTTELSSCFPDSSRLELKTDLNPSGYGIMNASLEQSEAYDQRVIGFFKSSLGGL